MQEISLFLPLYVVIVITKGETRLFWKKNQPQLQLEQPTENGEAAPSAPSDAVPPAPAIQAEPAVKNDKPEAVRRPLIRVTHLRKVYHVGDETVVALGDINFEIPAGQIVCIIGTSGSGKSTLLNQLAGLEKPTKGAVYIGNTNLSRLDENRLAEFRQKYLGFIFQSYNLLSTMSALENVALPMIFRSVPKSKRKKAALAMLAAVGLKKRAYHRPSQMSGGQQQRVGIARAFVTRPQVIFADEPTGNLDTKTTVSVMQMMVRFSRKYNETLVIVTHDPEISEYADRVITLIDGQITSDVCQTPIFDVGMESAEEAQLQEALDTQPHPSGAKKQAPAQEAPPAPEPGEAERTDAPREKEETAE